MLTEEDKDFGKRVWETLRAQQTFPVRGALWLFDPDSEKWNLVIASPRVEQIGVRDTYRELAAIIADVPARDSQWLQLQLVGPSDPTYNALRSAFGETFSTEGGRLNHSMVNGVFVEHAYLYEVR
jgi:hypothetical protein